MNYVQYLHFGKPLYSKFLYYILVVKIGRYETISVKIPSELKELMKRLGIKPSEVLRKAIEDEVRKRQVQKIKEEICEIKESLDKIPMEEIVRSIREDREQR